METSQMHRIGGLLNTLKNNSMMKYCKAVKFRDFAKCLLRSHTL